jgi:hypothetical protein
MKRFLTDARIGLRFAAVILIYFITLLAERNHLLGFAAFFPALVVVALSIYLAIGPEFFHGKEDRDM